MSTRIPLHSVRILLGLAGLLLVGCNDDSPAHTGADAGSAGSAATAPHALLAPPAKGRGVQFTMTTDIKPGTEVERCKFMRVGDDGLIVNHDEVRFSAGSHHVLLFLSAYTEIPTQDEHGTTVDTDDVFDCSDGVQGFWSLSGLVATSQSPNGKSAISFPAGVGVRIPPNAVLLANVHYINPSESTLSPQVYINLHTIPEAELETEGGLLFWYDPFLKVPANGHSVMRASCALAEDVHVTNAQSHMHRRGVGYKATLTTPDGEEQPIYTSDTWEDVTVKAFQPTLDVAAGSRIEFECEYDNPEARDVYQGPRSSDEMCMFIGSYYPRNNQIGFCSRTKAPFLAAQWRIGQGTASCAQSLQCIIDASSQSTGAVSATGTAGQSLTSKLTDCLLASKPSVSVPLSDMLGCLAAAPDMASAASSCSTEIATCQAAPSE